MVNNKGQKAWNKGLTKETDERVKKYSENKNRKKKISKTNKLQYKNGRVSAMKGKKQKDSSKLKTSNTLKKLYKEGKRLTGSKHQWWRGGKAFKEYGKEWNHQLRTNIKTRDYYICQKCGNRENLIVHHIDWDKKNNNYSNLITLCRHCHCKIHKRGNKKC